MERETLPRVVRVDLDPQAGLARAVEEFLGPCCCLVREKSLSPLESSTRVPRAGQSVRWRERGVTGVVVCATTIDSNTERKVALTLSRWRGFPTLLVAHSADPVVLSRLRRYPEVATLILRSIDVVARMVRLWSRSDSDSDSLDAGVEEHPALAELVAESRAFREVIDKLSHAARSDCTVLLQGATGTGKGVCARAIHELSARADKPFIPVNCGALPDNLIEAELFGHEKGAFTGAIERRAGLVQAAGGGTIFLDEVGALSLSAQVTLLRVLQERECRPVGSTKTLRADARIIAATSADMKRAVQVGRVRADLYYRLSVFPLTLPPLRERRDDIVPLAIRFLRREVADARSLVASLSPSAAAKLVTYDWPGNVRELENAIKRAVVLAGNSMVLTDREILLEEEDSRFEGTLTEVKARAIAQVERDYIEKLLAAHRGNVSQAARSAQTHPQTMWRLIRRYGIDVKRFRVEPR